MIQFDRVSKRYSAARAALVDISLTIGRGEMAFLSGPSGAGKSTLLKMVAAVERPSSGRLSVNGQDIGRLKPSGVPYLRRNLGLMFQQQTLLNDRSVLDNVMLPLLVVGTARTEAEKRARAALDKVGLLDKAPYEPLSLSGGEQQRAAVARALVNRPQIILADEPTANLDRASADRVMEALRAFHLVGVTCLIATHDEHLLLQAERVIRLDQGRLADGVDAGGSTSEVGA
jgi:cell division transport system ATP-binding protein